MPSELLDLIYSAIAAPSQWSDVLVGVSDYLGAEGGMLAYVPPPLSAQLPTQILGRLPEEPSIIFRQHYPWNPWTEAVAKFPFGKAVSANSLIEPGLIKKTAFYADVLAPWGHADIIDINHRALATKGSVGGFGFCLTDRNATSAEECVRKLDPLTPHLCRAFETSLLMGDQASELKTVSAILEFMPNGALIMDERGRVMQANAAAERLLQRSDGITYDRRGNLQLTAVLPSERPLLSRFIKNVIEIARGASSILVGSEPLRISRQSGAPALLILAVPLPRPPFAFWESIGKGRALVVIVDPSAESHAQAATMQAAFGLTAAEARVALLLASGVTSGKMPALLGLTTDTIKTHLRRCYAKTGTHSQAELMRLLTMLPRTPGPGK
jgi:DNA-binding CsgD family transcriptional regulator/PAS domain-containing protein